MTEAKKKIIKQQIELLEKELNKWKLAKDIKVFQTDDMLWNTILLIKDEDPKEAVVVRNPSFLHKKTGEAFFFEEKTSIKNEEFNEFEYEKDLIDGKRNN